MTTRRRERFSLLRSCVPLSRSSPSRRRLRGRLRPQELGRTFVVGPRDHARLTDGFGGNSWRLVTTASRAR